MQEQPQDISIMIDDINQNIPGFVPDSLDDVPISVDFPITTKADIHKPPDQPRTNLSGSSRSKDLFIRPCKSATRIVEAAKDNEEEETLSEKHGSQKSLVSSAGDVTSNESHETNNTVLRHGRKIDLKRNVATKGYENASTMSTSSSCSTSTHRKQNLVKKKYTRNSKFRKSRRDMLRRQDYTLPLSPQMLQLAREVSKHEKLGWAECSSSVESYDRFYNGCCLCAGLKISGRWVFDFFRRGLLNLFYRGHWNRSSRVIDDFDVECDICRRHPPPVPPHSSKEQLSSSDSVSDVRSYKQITSTSKKT